MRKSNFCNQVMQNQMINQTAILNDTANISPHNPRTVLVRGTLIQMIGLLFMIQIKLVKNPQLTRPLEVSRNQAT